MRRQGAADRRSIERCAHRRRPAPRAPATPLRSPGAGVPASRSAWSPIRMCARSKIDSASASCAVAGGQIADHLAAQRRDGLVPGADVAELRRAADDFVDRRPGSARSVPRVEIAPDRVHHALRPVARQRRIGRGPVRRDGPRPGRRSRARAPSATTAPAGSALAAPRAAETAARLPDLRQRVQQDVARARRRRAAAPARARTASMPSWRGACRTVVSGGVAKRASSTSSNPTTAMSSGTRTPRAPQGLERAQRHPVVRGDDGVAAAAGRRAASPPRPGPPRTGSRRG